jgi:hypothetical protein
MDTVSFQAGKSTTVIRLPPSLLTVKEIPVETSARLGPLLSPDHGGQRRPPRGIEDKPLRICIDDNAE